MLAEIITTVNNLSPDTIDQNSTRSVSACLRRRQRSQERIGTIGILYNQRRPHMALNGKTPDEFYFENVPTLPKSA
jgi:hypothetical protein